MGLSSVNLANMKDPVKRPVFQKRQTKIISKGLAYPNKLMLFCQRLQIGKHTGLKGI